MKVVKRDGRVVDYNRNKILIAVRKANAEVDPFERVSEDDIDGIIASVEGVNRETIQVEDIQDMIEQKLMAAGKFILAKTYIIYRYTRELVRKANTTDDSIMSLISNSNKDVMEENSNKNAYIASTQRDLIAGEVSKDLTKRVLLPEKIVKAHKEGMIHFHDMDYFIQPIFNCCLINIGDMLENGTVMNGKLIESPKSFQVACTVVTQIISAVASSQYGGQSVDVRHLGKYLRKSANKYRDRYLSTFGESVDSAILERMVEERVKDELRSGVQTIQYQINTLMTTNGQSPFVTLFLNLDKDDEYIEENAMIIEEILRQRLEGIKNEKGVYVTPLTLGMYGKGDFFDLKGVVEAVLDKLGIRKLITYTPEDDRPYLHPGRKADIMVDGQTIGFLGEIHPEVAENYNIGTKVYVAVLDVERLTELSNFDIKYKGVAKFPAVTRDISLVMKKNVLAGQVEEIIRKNAGKTLESVKLFDVYEGEQLSADEKSLAYSIRFRAADRTLEDKDVTTVMDKILKKLEAIDVKIRQ